MRKNYVHTSETDFEMDERYAICTRELWLTLMVFILNVLVVFALAYGIGYGRSPAELSFILGFPSWFFWGGLVATAIFSIVPAFLVRFGFKDIPITASGREMENE